MSRTMNRTRHFRLDPTLDAKLDALCKATSCNASEAVRKLLEGAPEHTPTPTPKEQADGHRK